MPGQTFQLNAGAYIKGYKGVAPVSSAAATVNGGSIDRQGFMSAILSAITGVATGTPSTQTVTVKIQDSADGSTGWADYTPDVGSASFTITADGTFNDVNVNLRKAKRYIRAVIVVAFTGGSSPDQLVTALVQLAGADTLPQ